MRNSIFEMKVLGSVSPYCKGNRNCPGFLINYYDSKILLDCGNGITRMLNFPEDLNNLSIFISHLHKDHYSDLSSIGYASYVYHKLGLLNTRINLYIPETKNGKENFYDSLLIKNMKEQYFNINEYNEKSKYIINGLIVSFLKNNHSCPSYCTKLNDNKTSLVYTGDTGNAVANQIAEFANNSDLLISESTLLKTDNLINENHLHAYQAAEIARLSKAKKLLLFHFWPEHNSTEYLTEAKTIFENTEVSEEGKVLTLQ